MFFSDILRNHFWFLAHNNVKHDSFAVILSLSLLTSINPYIFTLVLPGKIFVQGVKGFFKHVCVAKILCIIAWNFTKFYYTLYLPQVKRNLISTIILILFWNFLMFYQFFRPQVKRSVIMSNKHGINELP